MHDCTEGFAGRCRSSSEGPKSPVRHVVSWSCSGLDTRSVYRGAVGLGGCITSLCGDTASHVTVVALEVRRTTLFFHPRHQAFAGTKDNQQGTFQERRRDFPMWIKHDRPACVWCGAGPPPGQRGETLHTYRSRAPCPPPPCHKGRAHRAGHSRAGHTGIRGSNLLSLDVSDRWLSRGGTQLCSSSEGPNDHVRQVGLGGCMTSLCGDTASHVTVVFLEVRFTVLLFVQGTKQSCAPVLFPR
eukprot:gene11387-biopygen7847